MVICLFIIYLVSVECLLFRVSKSRVRDLLDLVCILVSRVINDFNFLRNCRFLIFNGDNKSI